MSGEKARQIREGLFIAARTDVIMETLLILISHSTHMFVLLQQHAYELFYFFKKFYVIRELVTRADNITNKKQDVAKENRIII